MAEVFAGHSMGSHGFQKPVAIKRLLPELANDHVFVERLIGEAKLLVGMQHGNIVACSISRATATTCSSSWSSSTARACASC